MSTVSAPPDGRRTPGARTPDSAAGRLPGRRRSIPHLTLGALLVAVCTLGFAVTATRIDHRQAVLVTARPVTVGQRLSSADLRAVRVAAGTGVDVISAADSANVVGQTVATNLPAGALLTRAELGPPSLPAAGQAVVALAVKAGQFPPDLAAGAHVLLIPTPAAGSAPASAGSGAAGWAGTVIDVRPAGEGQGSVVSVLLPQPNAVQVAATGAGQLSIVTVAGR
jgi:Chaperone for flagella basal body P-ring formation